GTHRTGRSRTGTNRTGTVPARATGGSMARPGTVLARATSSSVGDRAGCELHVQGPSPSSPSRGGFTLIELIAVVAMFALVAALVLPTFDVGRRREVRQAGERVGDAVELARQRAIMTGR